MREHSQVMTSDFVLCVRVVCDGRQCQTANVHAEVKVHDATFDDDEHETMPFGIDLGAPVNTALLLANLYFAQGIIFPKVSPPSETPNDYNKSYSWMPKSHPPTVIFETFTPKTLAKFDGKDDGRVLLAINGTVFDVTAGKSFYGPGSSTNPTPL